MTDFLIAVSYSTTGIIVCIDIGRTDEGYAYGIIKSKFIITNRTTDIIMSIDI